MSIPKYHEFMKPILEILQNDKVVTTTEIYQALVKLFEISDADKEERLSGGQVVYKNRIGWALAYLKKAVDFKNKMQWNIRLNVEKK